MGIRVCVNATERLFWNSVDMPINKLLMIIVFFLLITK